MSAPYHGCTPSRRGVPDELGENGARPHLPLDDNIVLRSMLEVKENDRERPSVAIYERGVEVELEDAPFHAGSPHWTAAVVHIV